MARKAVSGLSLIGGAGVGALLMYLFDPQEGEQRRSTLSHAANDAIRGAGGTLAKTWHDLSAQASELGERLSEHAHQVADRASDLKDDAGDAAGSVGSRVSDLSDRLLEQARRIGKAVSKRAGRYTSQLGDAASSARDSASDYASQAGGYASSARDYAQSYFHPKSSGTSVTGVTLTAAGALALGVGAMYLFDSEEGRQRREHVMGTLNDYVGQAGSAFRSTGQYLRSTFENVTSEIRGGGSEQGDQGESSDAGSHLHWTNTTRVAVGVAGGALGFYGAVRRDWVGLGAGVLGLGLVAAGLTKYDFSQLSDAASSAAGKIRDTAGRFTSHEPITVRKTIEINAPVQRVFDFWSNYANFPQIMPDVISVTEQGNGRSTWRVKGPGGIPVQWEAGITQHVSNEVIAWESIPGSLVYNNGKVRFSENGGGGTRVDIDLAYVPPAGALGHSIARLFGSDPDSDMSRDLEKVKQQLESSANQQAPQGA